MARHYSKSRMARVTEQNAVTHTFNPILRKRVRRTFPVTVTTNNAVEQSTLAQSERDTVNERVTDYRRSLRLCESKLCECVCRTCHAGTAPCVHDCKHATCVATFARIARDNNFAPFSFMHGICFERLPKTTEGVLANYVEHNARLLARLTDNQGAR